MSLPPPLDAVAAGVVITGADLRIRRANPAFARLVGAATIDVVLGLDLGAALGGSIPEVRAEVERAVRERRPARVERKVMLPSGGERWARIEVVPAEEGAFVWTVTDLTEQHATAERARRLAFFDELTALPNAALLGDRAEIAIASAVRRGKSGALVLVDIDGMKSINDTRGRSLGDVAFDHRALIKSEQTPCVG